MHVQVHIIAEHFKLHISLLKILTQSLLKICSDILNKLPLLQYMLSDITYRLWIFCFKITILLKGGHKILLYNTRNANRWSIDNITIANTVFYFCTKMLVYKYLFFMNYISKNENKSRMHPMLKLKHKLLIRRSLSFTTVSS